jgi:hypothetical protein
LEVQIRIYNSYIKYIYVGALKTIWTWTELRVETYFPLLGDSPSPVDQAIFSAQGITWLSFNIVEHVNTTSSLELILW